MKRITLAFVLIAGCAATNVAGRRDAKLQQLEDGRREIAARAKRCVLAAMKQGANEMPSTSRGDLLTEQVQIATGERDREISKCKAAEARENEELSSQERHEYVGQAQQERDNRTLITILTTSGPH
jgi:hypothetical protein